MNDYNNEPRSRQTNFGSLMNPRGLLVIYEGREDNRYATALGALKATHRLNDDTQLKFIASLFHTTEEEYSDIIASYALGEVNNDLSDDNAGEVLAPIGVGAQFNRTRNDLDALILNIEHKAVTIRLAGFGNGALNIPSKILETNCARRNS